MDIESFKKRPLLGILRGVTADTIEPLVETVVAAGLRTIEITMNTAGAPELIRKMTNTAADRLVVGAGTVLSMADLHTALDAGASFIVLPVLVTDVVEYCAENSIPVFPGALTPQEIYTAWNAGATMVKVFPANLFGPVYFKEIKGPFNDIELLACGGVNTKSIRDFFSSRASAVAFGGSVFKRDWIEKGEYSKIQTSIEALVSAWNSL